MPEDAPVIAALIRHGDYRQLPNTPSAHQPFALTATGCEQSDACADQLLSAIDRNRWRLCPVIDSSSLLRAWQTASIIGTRLGEHGMRDLEVAGFDQLTERGLGVAGNLNLTQIADVVAADPRCTALPPNWKADSRFCLPLAGAESLLQAGERVADHLQARTQEIDTADGAGVLKLFVGHGAALRHAAYHLGLLAFDELARLSMHHARPIFFAVDNGNWRQIGGAWKSRRTDAEPPD